MGVTRSSGERASVEKALNVAAFGLFGLGVAYLVFKVVQVAGQAGYDFRYIWLAGEMWSQGLNPYGPEYKALAPQVIGEGHRPTLWPYAPNWIVPSVALSLLGLDAAAVVYNILNLVALVASSALLTLALGGEERRKATHFMLHFGAMACLQATALVLSTGQNSILMLLGLSLATHGLVRAKHWTAAAGLTLLMLKPQLGLLFAAAMLMNPRLWGVVVRAAAISILVSLPALLVTPTAPLEWVRNLGLYDTMNLANAPPAMTGVRNLVFDATAWDMGNMGAFLTALVVLSAVVAVVRAQHDPVHLLAITVAVALAIAPLHTYDFVIVGPLIFALAKAPPLSQGLGVLGALLIWRADDLAEISGFHAPDVEHFPGSRIATLGAMLLLAGALAAARRRADLARTGAISF